MNYTLCQLLEQVYNLIKTRTKCLFDWNRFLLPCLFNVLECSSAQEWDFTAQMIWGYAHLHTLEGTLGGSFAMGPFDTW